jgi:predicted lipid-binding transport protein (Tim44 family)
MRSDLSLIFWIVLLGLMLTGTISFGSILSFIFGVIGFFILLALIGTLIFRHRLRKMQREAQEQSGPSGAYRTYTWHFGGGHNGNSSSHTSSRHHSNPNEGRVSVDSIPRTQKRVNEDVGEYVDFKEE